MSAASTAFINHPKSRKGYRRIWPLAPLPLLLLFMLAIVGVVQSSGNSIETPDTDGLTGWDASMQLDGSGNPIISYHNSTDGELKVMHCNDPNCAGGDESITTPDPTTDNVGSWSSMVLDGSGLPVIAYYDNTNGALKLMRCNDANCAGNNETITTVDNSNLQVGWYPSLVLDSSGFPVIAYHDPGFILPEDNSLKIMHCNDLNCAGADESITIPDLGLSIQKPSLVLDSSGYPVVSYFDGSNLDLKLLHCNDPNCAPGGDSITIPDSAGTVGQGSSLLLDGSGNPIVSYFRNGSFALKVLHCNDPNCDGVGDSITIPHTGAGGFTSMELDGSGFPVISHTVGNGLWVTRCNDVNCAGGDESNALVDSDQFPGEQTSLELDSNSYPVISYQARTNRDLRVAHCGTTTCIKAPPTPTPTNTPTSTPTNTPTATPTNTPTATATNTPTDTPTATNTPLPTDTPTPSDTPVPPTATATSTNTPVPPTPTDTPAPPTATPTSTPEPTDVQLTNFSGDSTGQALPWLVVALLGLGGTAVILLRRLKNM